MMLLTDEIRERIDRFVLALEERLRNSRGVNMRSPANRDVPHRADHNETCTFQEVSPAFVADRTLGGLLVPPGHFGILTHRAFAVEYWLNPSRALAARIRCWRNGREVPVANGPHGLADRANPAWVDLHFLSSAADTSFRENVSTHVYVMVGWGFYRRQNDGDIEPGGRGRYGQTEAGAWWTPHQMILHAGDSVEYRTDNADLPTEPRVLQLNFRGWTAPIMQDALGREGMVRP